MDAVDHVNLLILVASALVVAGIVSSLVATRFGAPLLLVFLVVGMMAGEDGPGGIIFNDYRTTYLVGSLSLAVILFDGGLRTRFSAIRGAAAPSIVLASLGVLATAALTGGAALLLVPGLNLLQALLLGSVVASTDAAAVFFLLRAGGLRLRGKLGPLLEMESGTNDPIAVFLTIILTELLLAGEQAPTWTILDRLAEQALIGTMFGIAGGFGLGWLLNRVTMSGGLHPLFVMTSAILLYAVTAVLDGSGLLAVYLAGLVLANRPVRAYPSIVAFHDATTWLCQIVMFLVLGLLVTPTMMFRYILPGLVVAGSLTLIARPAAVFLCLAPFRFSTQEKLFVSWVGLRGAVSIFLAAIPTLAGVKDGQLFFNVAFFVVLISLMVQGWTLTPAALQLGVALRRTAPSVSRVELDIPGQVGLEMVGYPIADGSVILLLSRLPTWARIVLVVRENRILEPAQAGDLQAGDYVYFLCPPERVARLDRIVAESPDVARRIEHLVGEFPINGGSRIADIEKFYDLAAPSEDLDLSVSEYFAKHHPGAVRPGHRLTLGKGVLLVREVKDGKVALAGLRLSGLIDELIVSALRAQRKPLAARIGPWLRALRPLTRRFGRLNEQQRPRD